MGRAVARHHDRLNARGVRNAQTRAEVARVGDAVDDEQERLGRDLVQKIREIEFRFLFFGKRHDPLVRHVGGHPRQTAVVGVHYADARGDEFFAHFAHALVTAGGVDINGGNRFGIHAKARAHGVKPGENDTAHCG